MRITTECVDYALVEEVARDLYIRALREMPPDVRAALERARARESSPTAQKILETILAKIDASETHQMLVCQDTGLPVYFVRVGEAVPVHGWQLRQALEKELEDAINASGIGPMGWVATPPRWACRLSGPTPTSRRIPWRSTTSAGRRAARAPASGPTAARNMAAEVFHG